MARELEDYRDNIALLAQMFPNKATLSVEEAAAVIGCDKRTIISNNDVPTIRIGRRVAVPMVGLARYLSKH